MSDVYRLVFRGEVLEGQHPAVVRRRLAEAADLDESALDKLFSGKPVVLKREADTATAARFQVMFMKAGARLRVVPVEADDEQGTTQRPALPVAAEPSAAAPAGRLELLPPGSDVLRDDERAVWEPREVDTGTLSLNEAEYLEPERNALPPAPDVSHLTVAEVGSVLAPARELPEDPVEPPELEVAAVGEDLGPARRAPPAPLDLSKLEFEVAPTGTPLDQRPSPAAPAAPDTSHLGLEGKKS